MCPASSSDLCPTIGVLLRTIGPAPTLPPESRPLGRAALRLEAQGLHTVFGEEIEPGRMSGWRPRPGGWARVDSTPLTALHDRYPSLSLRERHALLLARAGPIPVGNPLPFTELCRDKFATQRFMEEHHLPVPEIETRPERFGDRLREWGQGFLKPRFGAMGQGVRRVVPGDELPARGESLLPGQAEELLLQRAVRPPWGYAGLCLRVLAQRSTNGSWLLPSMIVRSSRSDPVANVSRGASSDPAEKLLPPCIMDELDRLCLRLCALIDGLDQASWIVELGIDALLDPEERLWLLELNHKPQGRLEEIARKDPARFWEEHVEACARPLRRLAALP